MTKKVDNQLERYIQGLKSLGKVCWISFGIMTTVAIFPHLTKNEEVKQYGNFISGISAISCLAGMYKNRKKIRDCLSLKVTNQELKDKYNLTGDTFIYKFK